MCIPYDGYTFVGNDHSPAGSFLFRSRKAFTDLPLRVRHLTADERGMGLAPTPFTHATTITRLPRERPGTGCAARWTCVHLRRPRRRPGDCQRLDRTAAATG